MEFSSFYIPRHQFSLPSSTVTYLLLVMLEECWIISNRRRVNRWTEESSSHISTTLQSLHFTLQISQGRESGAGVSVSFFQGDIRAHSSRE